MSDGVVQQVKVSLPLAIAGERRTIALRSVLRSVSGSRVLLAERDWPPKFGYLTEPLGFALRARRDSGVLWRALPRSVTQSRTTLIPLFALGAAAPGARPLLLVLADRLAMTPSEFVHELVISAYARLWVELAVRHGIAVEPHAQNLLLELDAHGTPTGRIVHRDLEDLHIDHRYRCAAGRYVPNALPYSEDSDQTYRVHRLHAWLAESLDAHFQGGVFWPLARRFRDWRRRGLVDRAPAENAWERAFVRSLEAELAAHCSRPVRLTRRGGRALAAAVEEARARHQRVPLPPLGALPFASVDGE